MLKLGKRGTSAFEFCIIGWIFLTLLFLVFDLGRYLIVVQSLRSFAGTAARDVIINCYTGADIDPTNSGYATPSACTGYTPDVSKLNVPPFLTAGGLTPIILTPVVVGSSLKITVTLHGFTMLLPIWWTTLTLPPSASVSIPFPSQP